MTFTLLRTHLDVLSQKIAESQGIIREFAANHYDNTKMFSKSEAELLSRSCVSQRDIQVCVGYKLTVGLRVWMGGWGKFKVH